MPYLPGQFCSWIFTHVKLINKKNPKDKKLSRLKSSHSILVPSFGSPLWTAMEPFEENKYRRGHVNWQIGNPTLHDKNVEFLFIYSTEIWTQDFSTSITKHKYDDVLIYWHIIITLCSWENIKMFRMACLLYTIYMGGQIARICKILFCLLYEAFPWTYYEPKKKICTPIILYSTCTTTNKIIKTINQTYAIVIVG